MVRNWHKFQPQKIDRLRWSTLPAPPDWEPEKYLPPRLLEKWKEDEKLRTFVPPPISNEWISGDSLEPERRHGGSKMSPLAETRRRRNGATAEPLARVGTDERKRERTDGGRVDDTTRGDIAGVEAPAPDPADSPVLVVTTPQSNGSPDALDWSDWENLSTGKRQLRLTSWLYAKHGWASVTAKTRDHEATMAAHIAELVLDGPTILTRLETWWDETDPDDRPSSLEYFWTRFQQAESEGLKTQRRSHARTSGTSRLSEGLPGIQDLKDSK